MFFIKVYGYMHDWDELRLRFQILKGSIETYVGGAFVFAQEAISLFFRHNGDTSLADGGKKKGTLIFSGTLGALRCSAEYAAYGAGQSSVRQLAQTIARELSPKGVQCVHTILNGGIVDAKAEEENDLKATIEGKKMHAEAIGKRISGSLSRNQQCGHTNWTSGLHKKNFRYLFKPSTIESGIAVSLYESDLNP